jgi:hypothetical protein
VVDHIVVFGEAHLRRILRPHAHYYYDVRTHRSLDKDAPVSRLAQRTGSNPILGGLHHHHHCAKFRFSVHTQDLTDPASRPLDQLGAKTSILGVGY